eukprot:TRINITY_DN5859_c0_g1_i2.p1 TRINITY_DN5859_c0_g1~~TRINITY_DN5859_c0_g1_i2.p1  ORF type:complete len:431 (-),score=115.97 TRINITY_DN5859_c0_g1_i2:708-2000(-)
MSSIAITTDISTFTLTGFVHISEAYNIINYFYKNPVSYVVGDMVKQESGGMGGSSFGSAVGTFNSTSAFSSQQFQQQPQQGFGMRGASTYGATTIGAPSSSGYDPYGGQYGTASSGNTISAVKVDLDASREALRRIEIARQYGVDALTELSYQGDLLNKAEVNIEAIHGDLDHTSQHIGGIESFAGHMRNMFSSNSAPAKTYGAALPDTAMLQESKGPETVDILRKREDCSLSPATVTISEATFCIQDDDAKKTLEFRYSELKEACIRTRPQHLDLRFHDGKRERMVTSYIQLIVNEIALRAPSVQISFEPLSKTFEYGDVKLRQKLSKNSKTARAQAKVEGGSAFIRHNQAGPSIEAQTASSRFKEDLLEQDRHIDMISDNLADMHYMARAMGSTLDVQSDQISRITGRVEEASQRMQTQNTRIVNQLH